MPGELPLEPEAPASAVESFFEQPAIATRARVRAKPGKTVFVLLALAAPLASATSYAADAALVDAARKEGKVVWYTTLIVNQAIRPLKEAFEKKYPGIELQYVRADESPTAAKIMAEAGIQPQ